MSTVGTPQGAVPWRLLDGYQPVDRVYDEMVAPPDSFRGHCEGFVRVVERLGRHELASRWENAKRTLRDNGVSYNVYGDPQGADRPWELDLMPLVISPAEWSRLERALVQRTRLLNLMLADIYGARRLLRDDLLPPALVLGNPAFLRPCHGIPVPRGIHLHLHAVDVARSPDGEWRVLADRTQAPSGAGYALENRIVLSRSLREPFRECHVRRMAPFFGSFRDALASLAQPHGEHPNVVLLTPGPDHETYFEHAYLARYLGLPLVEGADLTVRDRSVFIKTLVGLELVDVILRRLDDEFCDPLELRADSPLGVPGLVEAARVGNVSIANALGSGVIETAAILPFLPALAKHVLGEELQLQSVGTWWCGRPDDLQYVLDHLDELIARRAFPSGSREPVFGRKLGDKERAALAEELRGRPEEFVAQQQVAFSTAPVWLSHKLEARPMVLRAFVAAMGDSYVVMPGGLTRVGSASDAPIVSMKRGGLSKDTWVLSDAPVSALPVPPTAVPLRRERRAADLPSRVADNLFWLGRQAERAEHILRLLRGAVSRFVHQRIVDDPSELLALLHVLVALDFLPARLLEPMEARDIEHELFTFVFRPTPASPLRTTLAEVRRLSSVVRDRLSADTSRILNQLQQDFRLRHGPIQFDDVLTHLNRMITDLAAFSGMEMENMIRGHGWRFLNVGRRLERALNLTSLLRAAVGVRPSEGAIFEPLLEVADSTMTYRRRYFSRPELHLILDLLLVDSTNTRGLSFQLAALSEHMQHLPRDARAPQPTREERLIASASTRLRERDLDAFSQPDEENRFSPLVELLGLIDDDLRALSDTITHYYFSHAEQRVS